MSSTLRPFFEPRSIAVIGASSSVGTTGYKIVDNLVRHGYQGIVYPVNPNSRHIHSIRTYPSVMEIPGPVDLAVVVVPKERVPEVVDQCGRKGVPALVVISAGFREVGEEGARREAELMEQVRRYGMRLVGPNCMGILSTDPDVRMNATFAPAMPPSGAVSFVSQSGALGVTILDYAAEYGVGIRSFVSAGNKPDVSGNDLLEYWEHDPETRVILMYLENFGNPRRFSQIARRVARRKPIVVVKSGRTQAGARAASSHTGVLAGADPATDALLSQCGVIRADTVQELFDFGMAFRELPTPKGNRVAIVTNAGGPGIIIADACDASGLDVAELSPDTRTKLEAALPEEASVGNPVDMIATATADSYRTALDQVLQDPQVDAAIAAFVPPLGVHQANVAEAIVQAARPHLDTKPTLAVLMGREGLPEGRSQLQEAGIPAYIFPESAARSLGALHQRRRWLDRPTDGPRQLEADDHAVEALLDSVAAHGRTRLSEPEGLKLLDAYGVPVMPHRVATSPEEAQEAAHQLGLPAVLKVVSPDVEHKTDVGGVEVGLRTPEDVRDAYERVMESVARQRPDARLDGALVAPHLAGGTETIIGMSTDPKFGPVMVFGLGGIHVEVMGDVTFRLPPLSATEAREMIRGVKGSRLLEGARGHPPVDLELLQEVLERVSQLVIRHSRIAELDINPFLAHPDGGFAADAAITLQPS